MTDGNQHSGGLGNDRSQPEPQSEVLQYLLQNSAMPIVAMNLQGRFEYCSSHVAPLFQVDQESITSFNPLDLLSGRNLSILKAHLDCVIVDKQPARCEVELQLPDKRKQSVRFISHPGSTKEGTVLCWSNIENLTQIRRLEKTQALYQRASEVLGKSESLKKFSRQVFDLLKALFGIQDGYVALYDEQRGLITFPFFADTKDPAPSARSMEEGLTDYVITTGRMFWLTDEQTSTQLKGGSVKIIGSVPSDWIGVPLTAGGKVIGMTAIQTYDDHLVFTTEDIGLMLGVASLFEIFIARMDLEQTQQMLNEAVGQADETIVITDLRGIIQYVNPAFERKTGFTRDQAIGHSMSLISSGKHEKDYYREMWNDISSGKIWRGRFTNRKKQGTLYEEDVVISPIRNKDGDIVNYVGVKRDLSKENLAESNSLSARRIEVIEKLIESINHDFSNLLMIIRTNAEDLKKQAGDGEGSSEVEQIIDAVGNSETLIKNLSLIFSHEHDGSGVAKINERLIQFEPAAQRLVGELIDINFEYAPRMEPARIAWSDIEQVLFNLLIRASTAMKDGGSIDIRTHVTPPRKEDEFYFVDGSPSGERKCAVIEIADQGPVIPRNKYDNLFDSTSEDEAGGMAAVREIVAKQHGYIGVKENETSGMIFRLYFPVVMSDAPAPVSLSAPEKSLPRGSETILLAEDDEGARRVISRMLKDQGYKVLEAENGAMAVRLMLGRTEGIDLLLTDMMMPDFDGHELSEQSHGLKPDMKIVYVSGYNRADLQADGILDEKSEISLLQKPFKREELLALVRKTLDG